MRKIEFLLLLPALAQIRILSPKSLQEEFSASKGLVIGSTATFGAPTYGDRLIGQIWWARSDKALTHCSEHDYNLVEPDKSTRTEDPGNEDELPVDVKRIVLVRRGDCSFVTKVRIAEFKKNADAVIIIDKADSPVKGKDIREFVMGDDGWGDQVRIPSMMVTFEDGERMRKAAEKGEVLIELSWDLPQSKFVFVDFWFSAASREANQFISGFRDTAERLDEWITFVPHYFVFGLPLESDWCSNGKKYCAEDPDGPLGPVTGRDVVEEDKRQLCIWHLTANERYDSNDPGVKMHDFSRAWWDYVTAFWEGCPIDSPDKSTRFGTECSTNIITRMEKSLGVTLADVQNCVSQKGESYLDQEKQSRAWSPLALRINGYRYSGAFDPMTVERAICVGFASPPPDCVQLLQGGSTYSTLTQGAKKASVMKGVLVFTALITGLGVVFYLYKRYLARSVRSALREEVMLEVKSAVMSRQSNYAQLGDEQDAMLSRT